MLNIFTLITFFCFIKKLSHILITIILQNKLTTFFIEKIFNFLFLGLWFWYSIASAWKKKKAWKVKNYFIFYCTSLLSVWNKKIHEFLTQSCLGNYSNPDALFNCSIILLGFPGGSDVVRVCLQCWRPEGPWTEAWWATAHGGHKNSQERNWTTNLVYY